MQLINGRSRRLLFFVIRRDGKSIEANLSRIMIEYGTKMTRFSLNNIQDMSNGAANCFYVIVT